MKSVSNLIRLGVQAHASDLMDEETSGSFRFLTAERICCRGLMHRIRLPLEDRIEYETRK